MRQMYVNQKLFIYIQAQYESESEKANLGMQWISQCSMGYHLIVFHCRI